MEPPQPLLVLPQLWLGWAAATALGLTRRNGRPGDPRVQAAATRGAPAAPLGFQAMQAP